MNNIETMKLALEALLEDRAWLESDAPKEAWDKNNQAITSLRQAIEQAQQAEPVAWWDEKLGVFDEKHFDQLQPLYTSPPPRQPEQPKVRTGNCLRVGVCASEGHKIAPPRQPLKLDELWRVFTRSGLSQFHQRDGVVEYKYEKCIEEFARAIEAAHGIKENT